jgi:protein gp37
MADQRKDGISWTEWTWNWVAGCSLESPGCTNCYAMGQANRIIAQHGAASHYAGTVQTVNRKAVWTGKIALAPDHILYKPLRWQSPRIIFTNSMSDPFHEKMPLEWIATMFAIIAITPHHIYQVLTKRARHMREQMVGSDFLEITPMSTRVADALLAMWPDIERLGIPRYAAFKTEASIASLAALIRKEDPSVWPLKNVWFGVSAEDQQRANDRVRYLLETPAAIRFVSAEPLLGPIDFERLERTRRQGYGAGYLDALRGWTRGSGHGHREFDAPAKLDWIIVGGESGPDARPMHREWARSIRNQCRETGVAFHFKQWGEWMPADDWYGDHSVSLPLRTFDGERWRETSILDTDYSVRVGRRFSGRHLDNEIHNAFPIDIQIAA